MKTNFYTSEWKKVPGQSFEFGIGGEVYRRIGTNGRLEDCIRPYEVQQLKSRKEPIPLPQTTPPTI